jgi:hypothetical protein
VWGEEVEGEREVWGGEDGERFDEDVGDCLVAGEVRVELVSGVGLRSAGMPGLFSSGGREVAGGVSFR